MYLRIASEATSNAEHKYWLILCTGCGIYSKVEKWVLKWVKWSFHLPILSAFINCFSMLTIPIFCNHEHALWGNCSDFFSSNFFSGPVKDASNQTSLLKILQANGFVPKSYTSMRVFIDAFRVMHMVYFRVLECKSDLIRLTCPLIYSAGCCRGQVSRFATSRLLFWELIVLLYLSLSPSAAR